MVDLDRLMTFWAVEVLLTHRDGFAGNANNYFARGHDFRAGQLDRYTTGTGFTLLGMLAGGELELLEASTSADAPVRIAFRAPIARRP